MKKKIITSLTLLTLTIYGYGQEEKPRQAIERNDNSIYIKENGTNYLVDKRFLIVKPKESKKINYEIKIVKKHRLGYLEIKVPEDIDVEQYAERLEKSGDFESIEYVTEGYALLTPNDWHLNLVQSYKWYMETIKLFDAWDITTGSSSIRVAILDSGINSNHKDIGYGDDSYTNLDISLSRNYIDNSPYDPERDSHGTNVAGLIAAKTNNREGVAGIAGGNNSHGTTITSYRIIEDINVRGNVADAIIDATNDGAQIINCSFRCTSSASKLAAIAYAYAHGVTIICATGNENSNVAFPASDQRTIAIGATNPNNYRWIESSNKGSNYGAGIDIVAPGENIYVADNYSYSQETGTSFSAPLVSGTIALMISVNPSLTPTQIRDILRRTAIKVSGYSYNNGWNNEVGYGVLNTFAAVLTACNMQFLENSTICHGSSSTFSLNNLPSGLTVQWSISDGFGPSTPTIQKSGNSCTITNNLSMSFTGKLNAKVYKNGELMATLTKNLILNSDFYGQYTSDNLSGTIDYTHIFNVMPGVSTVITSPNLIGATVSYINTGTTPTSFSLDSSQGKLFMVMPANNGGKPIIINVADACGNHYQLYAMPQGSYHLNISYEGSNINISLNEDAVATKSLMHDQPWSCEIRSATMGDLKTSKKVNSRSTTISTTGWPKGIYIIKATIGKEEATEKIIVK